MDWEFFWAGEGGRDRLLRERQEYLAAQAATQAGRQRALANEMANLRGDVDQRLAALTRAFQAYVALDDVRTALSSFPDQARARRWAKEDIDALLDKQPPAPRNDTPGYWLTPAVAALRPDGSLLDELAEIARQRDARSALLLWTTVRGILDAGRSALKDLPAVLKPENGWDARQATLFRATIEGTFGPDGVKAISGVVADIVESSSPEEWLDWISKNAGVPLSTSTAGLDWLEEQLSFPSEPLSLSEDGGRRDALMSVVDSLINQGVGEEHQLMAKAAKLREIVSNPQNAPELNLDSVEDEDFAAYIARHDPLSVIRATAIDPQAPVESRRVLWQLFKQVLTEVLDQTADQPAAPVVQDELIVAGVRIPISAVGADEAAISQAHSKIEAMDSRAGSHWKTLGIGGLATGAVGAVMAGFQWPGNSLSLGIVIVCVALGMLYLANRQRGVAADALSRRQLAVAELESGVPTLTNQLQRRQQILDEQTARHRQQALALKDALP